MIQAKLLAFTISTYFRHLLYWLFFNLYPASSESFCSPYLKGKISPAKFCDGYQIVCFLVQTSAAGLWVFITACILLMNLRDISFRGSFEEMI